MNAVELKKAEMNAKIGREREKMHAMFQEKLAEHARREKALLLTAEIEVEIDVLVAKRKEATALNDTKEVKALDEQIHELNSKSLKLFRENFIVGFNS